MTPSMPGTGIKLLAALVRKCHDIDDSGDSDAYDHCDGDHGEPVSAEALHPFPLSQVLETLASLPQMSA